MKKVLIIGAGPAGLTAAYELLNRSDQYEVVVFEESDSYGGISRTANYKGNRMDMGGHRFFSKVPEVNAWWEQMMPTQGKPSFDDRVLHRSYRIKEGGPDPEKEDLVMLIRSRLSRIYFKGKFFDYPVSLKPATLKNMGFFTTIAVGASYLVSRIHKRPENSLEDFYINRFGKKLYAMFFENYTENLWGRHPREISPEWGAQRVKGLSVTVILKDILQKGFRKKNKLVETSLIESFAYPKLGPGQLWDNCAEEVVHKGGTIHKNTKVTKILKDNRNRVTGILYEREGYSCLESGDYVISSMPIKDLVAGMENVPKQYAAIAAGLPYRDYMTIGVLVKQLKIQNSTKIKTLGNSIPDNWVYVHEKKVKMGRFQIYNNWSPYLVRDPEHTIWLGLEYFCNENDSLWSMTDEEFFKMGVEEMVAIGLIEKREDVLDYHVERVKKAYPAYFDTYNQMHELRDYLDSIPNLFCVGRNGQHRYNNIDHSMCTSFVTVEHILSGNTDKKEIWNVNTEKEYHESP